MLSELKVAFQIGAVLFLPFLIIDLVVASVTVIGGHGAIAAGDGLGSVQDSLFVLVDGWNLVIGSLARSFN